MGNSEIRRIAVIGAGLMGHGIAQEFALHGYEVSLQDLTEDRLKTAIANMGRNLRTLADAGLVDAAHIEAVPRAITVSTSLAEAAKEADLVIEAISEDLPLKRRIFGQLDEICPDHTILASNSSTFMPSSMASATKRPHEVLVTHYFNPPYLVPLVEVVRHPGTSDDTFDAVFGLLERIGKRPVAVRRETLGFIGNRLQFALLRECVSLVEKGVATPEDVDTVVKNGFGRRLAAAGPFEIFDTAGWDVVSAVLTALQPDLDTSPTPSALVMGKVRDGHYGVKTGKGFYEWTPESGEDLRQRIAKALIEVEKWPRDE